MGKKRAPVFLRMGSEGKRWLRFECHRCNEVLRVSQPLSVRVALAIARQMDKEHRHCGAVRALGWKSWCERWSLAWSYVGSCA